MELTAKNLIDIGRRWWWLLLLAPLVAGSVAFFQVSRQQELYRAAATVEINPPSIGADTFSYYDPSIVATYQELITTTAVLGEMIERLNLSMSETELRSKVSLTPVEDTRLMRIAVSDPDPEVAAYLANEIAFEFAQFAEERTETLTGPYRLALDQQIQKTEADIAVTEQLIDDLLSGEDATSPEVAAQVEIQRTNLRDLQSTLTQLVVSANQMELQTAGAQTGVVVVQSAFPPTTPYAPDAQLYTLLAAFAGLCIAIGAIALYEYLDNTTKLETPYQDLIGAPLLATIPMIPGLGDNEHAQLFVAEQPASPQSEAVRLLRTNVEFAAAGEEIATLAISSSSPAEGKSTTAANLAAAMAQAGFSVAIVDADLRKPSLHSVFDVRNDRGLSNLLVRPEENWRMYARPRADMDLYVIPSGPIPPNPADLLRGANLPRVLDQISEQVDVVVVDTPPVLAGSDTLLIASATDAILMVGLAGRTRVDKLEQAVSALPSSARVIGLLLNQQTGNPNSSYYYYYSDDADSSKSSGGGGPLDRIRGWLSKTDPDSSPVTDPGS